MAGDIINSGKVSGKKKSYEKLGLFYLGREIGDNGETIAPMLLRSRDLTTHGVIIGMTGSGKTGLGIGLIEEAIMDGIPSIIIDPKGDMGNLLLTFPDLQAQDFQPWLEQSEASRKGLILEQYAQKTAAQWRDGLAAWDQKPDRIRTLARQAEITIYTPGGGGGVPVSVLAGFAAPAPDPAADPDTLNDLVTSAVSGLLALLQIDADPMQSREHILLSSILLHYWQKGNGVDMEALIGAIVSPPIEKIGAFALETYYKQSDRMQLAMRLNSILASPSFAGWVKGEPLDIQRILYTDDGRPKTAIFSISHLTDSERMFFVTLLLNRFVGWMRMQRGSSSLKMLLYMDEIYGFFPPTANPPSKKPMLLILKQARAFGCGVVLSTQNPVDLDYRGLSNMGSWFIGRLQTDQDRKKVAGGIAGASDGRFTARDVELLLAKMKGRQFLLNSANLDEPMAFETRWVMSFLKGPLTSKEIEQLMADKVTVARELQGNSITSGEEGMARSAPGPAMAESSAPILAGQIEQRYYLPAAPGEKCVLQPAIAARCKVRFFNASRNINETRLVQRYYPLGGTAENFPGLAEITWSEAEELPFALEECFVSAPSGYGYAAIPAEICAVQNLRAAEKSFADALYRTERLELFRVKSLKLESVPHETLTDFKVRLRDLLRENKDEAVDKLRAKYDLRQQRLHKKIQQAHERLQQEEAEVRTKTTDTILSFGVAVVGALFGRRSAGSGTSGFATGMRKAGRVFTEKDDARRVRQELGQLQSELELLAGELEQEIDALGSSFSVENYQIETFTINPRRKDIFDVNCFLVWELAEVGDILPS
ncbi:ATP-binding protein [Desulfosediminicola ganghwensis]|uniref:ATP-binding protein n=1 Tax=Desulfosediminicola ganghwensis TaxID=2569540 RepID=UPI0010ACF078|nr:DUF87 domain-containing protein [Desulfosediminicola ganghwensis]